MKKDTVEDKEEEARLIENLRVDLQTVSSELLRRLLHRSKGVKAYKGEIEKLGSLWHFYKEHL